MGRKVGRLCHPVAIGFCVPMPGSRDNLPAWWAPLLKSNILSIFPAFASNDWFPSLPNPQLSSIKRMIDVWSVMEWSTKFVFEYVEITNNGRWGPYPHRSWYIPGDTCQHRSDPRSLSYLGSLDWLIMGGITWSYHPSESSYEMMIAVSFHSGICSIRLIVETRKCSSSIGSEYPACPFWYLGAFRKLTSG